MSITNEELVQHVSEMMTPILQDMARGIDEHKPEGWGFCLMVFETGKEHGGTVLSISDCERDGVLAMLTEYLKKKEVIDGIARASN